MHVEHFVNGKRVDTDEKVKQLVAKAMETHQIPSPVQRIAEIEKRLGIVHGAPDGTRYRHDEDGKLEPIPVADES